MRLWAHHCTNFAEKFVQSVKNSERPAPRRFGKSLLTSTLKAFFAGQRELFQGLAIEKLEKEWVEYPVLHFDMSTAKHKDVEGLELELSGKLTDYEKIYGS